MLEDIKASAKLSEKDALDRFALLALNLNEFFYTSINRIRKSRNEQTKQHFLQPVLIVENSFEIWGGGFASSD